MTRKKIEMKCLEHENMLEGDGKLDGKISEISDCNLNWLCDFVESLNWNEVQNGWIICRFWQRDFVNSCGDLKKIVFNYLNCWKRIGFS